MKRRCVYDGRAMLLRDKMCWGRRESERIKAVIMKGGANHWGPDDKGQGEYDWQERSMQQVDVQVIGVRQ